MIYLRLLIIVLIVMMFCYYLTIIGHLFGIWKLTNKQVKFPGLLIPFFYWFGLENEKPKKTRVKRMRKD